MNAAERQAKVVGVVLAVILTLTGVAGIWQASVGHPAIERQAERVAAERHFWRAVAGEESTSAASVENQLAQDLASTPKSELGSFRGDSNRYGGITDAIGFDPFNGSGQNCSECGPLKESVRSRVALAKSGQVGQVIASVPVPNTDPAFVLTPFGISAFVWVTGIWLLVGHASYLAAGGTKRDARMWISAPGLAAWSSTTAWKAEQAERSKVSAVFPDAMQQIDEIDDFLSKLPKNSAEAERLRVLRNEVETELKRQAEMSVYNRDDAKVADATARLTAISDALQGRAAGFAEVDQIDEGFGIDSHRGGTTAQG